VCSKSGETGGRAESNASPRMAHAGIASRAAPVEQHHRGTEGEQKTGCARLGKELEIVVLGVLDPHVPGTSLVGRQCVHESAQAVADQRATSPKPEAVLPHLGSKGRGRVLLSSGD
jgi:hypothetical protein